MIPLRQRLLRSACPWALPAFLCACASYPERTREALTEFKRGEFESSVEEYLDPDTTRSEFLAGAEAGSVALAAGDWDGAIEYLARAAEVTKNLEREALLSPARLGEGLLSWTLSEGARTYEGEGYERVMLHAQMGLAYLARGELEDVHVEVRLANGLLQSEEELYEKSYAAGGFGHLISAISYELQGKLDEAYIDYVKMEEKGVGRDLAGRALVRLARRLNRTQDIERWEEKYGDTGPPIDPDHDSDQYGERPASVVVVAGVGLGPFKREFVLHIPTHDGLLQWTVPQFETRAQPISSLELEVSGGESTVRTVVVEDVGRVAAENLSDRIAWLAARSGVRAMLKRELTIMLEDQFELVGRVVGDLFTLFSERADLRSWQTLPDTWQACRAFLPPGTHALFLNATGGERVHLGTFELEPGETLFVIARTLGTQVYAYPIGGLRVDGVLPTPGTAVFGKAPNTWNTPETDEYPASGAATVSR